MPRLRQVPRSEVHPFGELIYGLIFGDRDPVAEPGHRVGHPRRLVDRHRAGARRVRPHRRRVCSSTVRPTVSCRRCCASSGQLRTGWARGSQFVYSQHCKAARDVGLSERAGRRDPPLAGRGLLDPGPASGAGLHRLPGAAGRAGARRGVRRAARPSSRDEEILELTYITCTYDMHATMSKALRMEYDDVDDPMVEVPDPDGNCAGLEVFVDGGNYADLADAVSAPGPMRPSAVRSSALGQVVRGRRACESTSARSLSRSGAVAVSDQLGVGSAAQRGARPCTIGAIAVTASSSRMSTAGLSAPDSRIRSNAALSTRSKCSGGTTRRRRPPSAHIPPFGIGMLPDLHHRRAEPVDAGQTRVGVVDRRRQRPQRDLDHLGRSRTPGPGAASATGRSRPLRRPRTAPRRAQRPGRTPRDRLALR